MRIAGREPLENGQFVRREARAPRKAAITHEDSLSYVETPAPAAHGLAAPGAATEIRREPEHVHEAPDGSEGGSGNRFGIGLQQCVQSSREALVKEWVLLRGSQPQHELAQHAGARVPTKIPAQCLPFTNEIKIRERMKVPVWLQVEGCRSLGEELEHSREPAPRPQRSSGHGRLWTVVQRHETQDLARVAVRVGLQHNAARCHDRHAAKLPEPSGRGKRSTPQPPGVLQQPARTVH